MFKKVLFILILVLSLVLAACTVQPLPTSAATAAPVIDATSFPSAALFEIVLADGTHYAVTAEIISTLNETTETIDGVAQTGLRLTDLLKAAGVKEYKELIFSGSASLTAPFGKINGQFILVLSDRGTYRMATPYIPQSDWVEDITTIEVK